MTKHSLEMAKALVLIDDGKIEVLTDPQIRCCPLRKDLYGISEESRDTVENILKSHIEDLGMYSSKRVLELNERPVSFGASEILADAMDEGLIDAAVVVCEGAGTVIATKPEVLQAIGAHMTGLLRTEPIAEVQEGLEEKGCILLDRLCTIDQVRGFERATEAGFSKIAVTIAGKNAFVAEKLKELGGIAGREPIILAVHTTGISETEAEELADSCDLVWSCASRAVRDVVGKKARLQIGISIPVFALTKTGKRLVLNRAINFDDGLVINRASLPVVPEGKQPEPLI